MIAIQVPVSSISKSRSRGKRDFTPAAQRAQIFLDFRDLQFKIAPRLIEIDNSRVSGRWLDYLDSTGERDMAARRAQQGVSGLPMFGKRFSKPQPRRCSAPVVT